MRRRQLSAADEALVADVTQRLGPACGRILPDVDGGICGREPGHEGEHVDGAQGVAMSMGRCAELSPDGKPCVIPLTVHDHQWGPAHSWERCTSMLVMGFPKTRCKYVADHEGDHAARWPRLGQMEGIEL